MRGLRVAVPDGWLAVREQGHGPPVLLVHGGTGTAAHDWADVAPRLRERRRVITVDLRAHGASANGAGELAMRRFAGDLIHVLRRLGISRCDMVGFSMGANTVLALLTRHPRLASRAVLIGGSATGSPDRIRALAATEEWPRGLQRLRHDVDPSPDYWRRLRAALLQDWADNTEVPTDRLARVDCPVLVVSGEQDPMQHPDVSRHLATSLPDARLELLPRAGHAAHLDRPGRFHELLEDFLSPVRRPVGTPKQEVVAC